MDRQDVEFRSGRGDLCRAWHYRPGGGDARTPVIVMAHGFGGTRNAGLESYAERFCEEGYAVVLFDYRHFGASEGEPRQLLSVPRQLEDWRNAVDFARGLEGVDAHRVALWGSSFSGGHVVDTAARVEGIAAVVSQGSMLDGIGAFTIAARNAGFIAFNLIGVHAMIDLLVAPFGGAHTVPVFGPPRSVTMLAAEDTEGGYGAIVPENFVNAVAARIGLMMPFYRPVSVAHRIECPLLLQVCEKDTLVSTKTAGVIAERLGDRCELIRYPNGHFDIYVPPLWETAVGDQLDFFGRKLRQ